MNIRYRHYAEYSPVSHPGESPGSRPSECDEAWISAGLIGWLPAESSVAGIGWLLLITPDAPPE
jgi:hypothetical protein